MSVTVDTAYKANETGRFYGRVAIVTGSSSGIGRAIALALSQEGAQVICSDLTPEVVQTGFEDDKHIPTHQVIANSGGKSAFHKCDMAKTDEIWSLIEYAAKEFGQLDILVNNAGITMHSTDFVEQTDEIWDSVMDINGKGVATAMRQAIKQFLRQPVDPKSGSRGRIVNISSTAGIVPVPGASIYAASKAAVSIMTQNVAIDHAKDFINVNAVCPGMVRTSMCSSIFNNPAVIEQAQKGTPWPRLGEPSDIAKAVVFLLSDEAQWITGQNLAVDGGFTAGKSV